MHIPDALLDPRVVAATSVAGGAGLLFRAEKTGAAARRADDRADGDDVGLRVCRSDGKFSSRTRCFGSSLRWSACLGFAWSVGWSCGHRGRLARPMFFVRGRGLDGARSQFHQHGADWRSRRLFHLCTDPTNDRRTEGCLDRRHGSRVVLSDSGVGSLCNRAGGHGTLGRLFQDTELDGTCAFRYWGRRGTHHGSARTVLACQAGRPL